MLDHPPADRASTPMLRALAALLLLAAPPALRAAPRRQADHDAIREARRPTVGRYASPRAIAHYLEARRHLGAGRSEEAAQQYRLAVAYDEESPELRVSLAEALAEIGDLSGAEGEARRALELSRAGPAAAEAHVLLGRIASARRQREPAILAFRSAIRIESALAQPGAPPDPEPWRQLAALYVEAGEEEAAVKTLEDLAARAPNDGTAFRELGRAYLERRDAARAERQLRRAAQLAPRDVEVHRLLAQAHEALRREPDVRDDLLAVLRVEPDDPGALLGLGRLAVRHDDVPQAREWFHRYVRAGADRADAYLRVVFQWLEGDNGNEALAVARAGLEDVGADPRLRFAEGLALQEQRRWPESAAALAAVPPGAGDLFIAARVAQADALSRARKHAEAEKALEAPLSGSPRDVRLVTMRATVLDRAGRAKDSVALLRRAVADRERGGDGADLPELYVALAESLVRAGRPKDAISALRGAVATRPRDETLLYALASAYDQAGQGEAALGQMRALLAIAPNHSEALNFVGYTLADQGVKLEEAERLVRRALELNPRSGHVHDSLGWVLYRRGDFRAAVDALERADRLTGPDPIILGHLGDAYRAAGRAADAAAAYRRALGCVSDAPAAEQGRLRAALERKLRDATERAERSRGR
jgi:tetratricopeptide (TPR) repeat protein